MKTVRWLTAGFVTILFLTGCGGTSPEKPKNIPPVPTEPPVTKGGNAPNPSSSSNVTVK